MASLDDDLRQVGAPVSGDHVIGARGNDLADVRCEILVKNGVEQSKELMEQEVTSLNSYRGAYDVGDDYWVPGSNWMPYGLDVLKTMAASELFAKKYYSISIIPEIDVTDLPRGLLSQNSYQAAADNKSEGSKR